MDQKTETELIKRFTSHICDGEQRAAMMAVRQSVRLTAYMIGNKCPEGRDKETALTHLQAAMMYANAAISAQGAVDLSELAPVEASILSEAAK